MHLKSTHLYLYALEAHFKLFLGIITLLGVLVFYFVFTK